MNALSTPYTRNRTHVCPRCKGQGLKPSHDRRYWRRSLDNPEDRCPGCKGKGYIAESHWQLMLNAQRLAHRALSEVRRG